MQSYQLVVNDAYMDIFVETRRNYCNHIIQRQQMAMIIIWVTTHIHFDIT
jgi:hypothetical protein